MQTQQNTPAVISERPKSFAELYLTVRKKEGRVYSDSEVAKLPNLRPDHMHLNEWLIRGRNCKKLLAYLKQKSKPLQILEVGCGNGWLSAQISRLHFVTVTGIDVNTVELDQAKRVFKHLTNVRFEYGDLKSGPLYERKFDIIIFAASIQYFRSVEEILSLSMHFLADRGEIHILDTLFYRSEKLGEARERTRVYYESMGTPELTSYYFHHSLDELRQFSFTKKYDPTSFLNRLLSDRNPFYWICVKKQ